jgi:hypothetical protein
MGMSWPIAAVVLSTLLFSINTGAAGAPGAKASSSDEGSFSTDHIRMSVAGVPLTVVDPRTGVTLWTANIANGRTSSGGLLAGELDNVDGVFYEKGKPADHFIAAKVFYDDKKKVITAFGGVKVVSLTQKVTTLVCDTLTWTLSNNKLYGVGHVVLTSGKFTQSGPSFLADTRMEHVLMPAPGGPKSTVGHTIVQP